MGVVGFQWFLLILWRRSLLAAADGAWKPPRRSSLAAFGTFAFAVLCASRPILVKGDQLQCTVLMLGRSVVQRLTCYVATFSLSGTLLTLEFAQNTAYM